MKRGVKRKIEGENSKGLSTIVATLFIITLVLVAVVIVWFATKNVIQISDEQIGLGKVNLNLEIRSVTRDVVNNSMSVKIKRNPGKGQLSGVQFILDNGKNTEIVKLQNISLNELEQQTYDIPLSSSMNVNDLETVSVAPIFISESGKEIVGEVSDYYIFPKDSESSGKTCNPDCSGKSCGDDGCEGTCGDCSDGDTCNSLGQCIIPTIIGTCGDLSVAGATYLLNSNVTSSGTCFNITSSNIILDCNNYWINYTGLAGLYGPYGPGAQGVYSNESNIIIRNCNIVNAVGGFSLNNYGIYLFGSKNSMIFNNSIYLKSGGAPIKLDYGASYNSLVENKVATDDYIYGIYITSNGNPSFGNTLINNMARTSSSGIYIFGSPNNTLINNTGISRSSIRTPTGSGISIGGSPNTILINNTGISDTSSTVQDDGGISLSSSPNSILINNKGIGNGVSGIILSMHSEAFPNNNTIINNTAISSTHYGMSFIKSSNNVVTNNVVTNTGGDEGGIYFSYSSNSTLINNIVTSSSTTGRGIYLYFSQNNNFINQTAKILRTTGMNYGIYFYGSNNTIFRDCVEIKGNLADVYYETGEASKNNTFINCSYSKETVQGGGVVGGPRNELIRKWYYRARVSGGVDNSVSGEVVSNVITGEIGSNKVYNFVSGANVSAYNNLNVQQFTALTDSSGWIDRQEVIEYVNTGGAVNTDGIRNYYSIYTINASLEGYITGTHYFDFTAQKNKIDDSFSI